MGVKAAPFLPHRSSLLSGEAGTGKIVLVNKCPAAPAGRWDKAWVLPNPRLCSGLRIISEKSDVPGLGGGDSSGVQRLRAARVRGKGWGRGNWGDSEGCVRGCVNTHNFS